MTRNIRWWNRLGVKLGALIALVTLVTIGALTLYAIRTQERHIVEEVVRGGSLLSETIKSSIYHHMLEDRRHDAYLVMDAIGRQRGMDGVRMFNADGEITFSTNRDEVGKLVDRRTQGCSFCHEGGGKGSPEIITTAARVYHAEDGHRVLGMVTPVYNEKSCSTAACHAHPESQRVLGVIDVGLSLGEIDRNTDLLGRQTLIGSAIAILVLAVLVILFSRRFVVTPVLDIVQGTRWIAEDNLERDIRVRSADEVGLLAKSFNEMTASLRSARADVRDLMQNLERQVEERTAALRQAQEQLVQSEKLSSLGRLSASIAHEINNPLMGILTVAKLLLRGLEEQKDPDPARQFQLKQLRMVQRETERCSAIVRNLLDFARQRPLTLTAVDVRAPLDEALSVAGNQISMNGVTVVRQLAAVPPVKADLGQVRQAFLNVVLNACDAMPRGGTLTITARLLEPEHFVQVEIADTGTGIAPEILSKIFDPFFTTKEKGTGLGLSVVYGIVQRHSGRLDVRSQPGQGTRILISLPAAAQEAVA